MKLASCEANFILPLRYENVNRESEVHFIFGNSGLLSIKLSYVTLRHMSIGAGIIAAVPLQEIDNAPHAQTSAQRNNESLQSINSGRKELHITSISPGGSPAMKKAAYIDGACRTLGQFVPKCCLYKGVRVIEIVIVEDVLVLLYEYNAYMYALHNF